VVSSTPRPHFTPGKDLVPILQEAGWASGPVCTGRKSRPHRDSIPDRPARSQSLHNEVQLFSHIVHLRKQTASKYNAETLDERQKTTLLTAVNGSRHGRTDVRRWERSFPKREGAGLISYYEGFRECFYQTKILHIYCNRNSE